MIVHERSSIINETNNSWMQYWKTWKRLKKRFCPAKKRFFQAKTHIFSLNNLYFLRGINHCPGRTKVTYVPAMGPWTSLIRIVWHSLALSNGRMILNSESATKFCQINCVAVSMFYILFLWGWRARVKSRIPRNDLFSWNDLNFLKQPKLLHFHETPKKKQTMRM